MPQVSLLIIKTLSVRIKILTQINQMKISFFTFLLIIFSALISNGQDDTSTYLKNGDNAPVFICKTIDGKEFDLSKAKGRIVMINFFATWCGPCNQELPVLQETIWEKYRNNPDFSLIVLGREHTDQEVKDFVNKHKFTMPFAPDPGREIFKLYASKNIPRNVIVGKDGKIIFQNIGYTKEDFSKIEKILAENLK
jgi:peroxiredoxin